MDKEVKNMTKWFWISIIAIIIIAIVAYVVFMYFQVILDAIMGLIQGIINFFTNPFGV